MQSLQRKLLANRFLRWLEETKQKSWPLGDTENVISEVGTTLNEPAHAMWKSYDLLRLYGKIVNNSNIVQVVNYQPLDTSQPLRIDVTVPEELVKYCSRKGISVDSAIDVAISRFLFEVIYKEGR